MKIATWNVNSVRARLGHLEKFLGYASPDLLCLQETKVVDQDFPQGDILGFGYTSIFSGQKSYNGVALLSRLPPADPSAGFPHLAADHPLNSQKRLIQATYGDVRVIAAYIPNGEEVGSEKYSYKMEFFQELHKMLLESLSKWEKVIICGDFNVAFDERDLYNPKEREGAILFSDPEREALRRIAELGYVDCFRNLHEEGARYSWWDYRGGGFWKNLGMRLDYLFASPALAANLTACEIDDRPRRWKTPSDHTPVWAEFSP